MEQENKKEQNLEKIELASLRQRFLGYLYDIVIFVFSSEIIVLLISGYLIGKSELASAKTIVTQITSNGALFLLVFAYSWLLTGKYGFTLG